MKILRQFLGGTLLFLLGVSPAPAQTETERTFSVYCPTNRVTSLTSGNTYMIYNTTWNGSTDRTGFIGSASSGFSHTGAGHPKPTNFKTTSNIYLWTITTGDEDCSYYFRSVAAEKYASATGTYTADPTSLIYVQDYKTAQCPTLVSNSTITSENSDGSTKTVLSSLTENSGVWAICGTSVSSNGQTNGNGDCWNGDPSKWAKWGNAHPYAFYEYTVETVTLPDNYPIPGKKYYIYCDNDTRQFFYNDNGTLKVTNEMTKDAKLYQFTCTSFDGMNHQFYNESSGKYFGYQAFSNTGYNIQLSHGSDNLIHIKCVDAGKFLVMHNNGSFNQATSADNYKKGGDVYSADYVFVPVENVELNNVIVNISVDIAPSQSSAAANLTYTINGNEGTKSISATQTETISLVDNSTLSVSSETLRGYDCTITKGEENYDGTEITLTAPGETVFNIAYTANAERVAVEVENEVTPVLALTGVGYPRTDAASRATLSNAAAAALSSEGTISERLESIATAITAYKSSTDDIQMPEDGKTYVFTNVHPTAGKNYINYAETGLTLATRGTDNANDLPQSAKFTCQIVDGRYMFVNNEGKYLIWRGSNEGQNSQKGYMDAYDATHCTLFVEKMALNGTDTSSASSLADLFGYVCFGGKRVSKNTDVCFIISANSTRFNQDGTKYFRYSTDHSTAFIFEEVDYANHPTLLEIQGCKISGIEGETHIGTFSAPFETEIPEGVRAYYASAANADTGITLQEITTGTVPANSGVIITATTATPGYFAPATTVTTLESNQLSHSAGAAHTIVENDYILATSNSVTALYKARVGGSDLKMNKAFLNLGTSLSPAFMLNFDDALTGIFGIESQADTNGGNAPLYDLSGRRIAQPLRSGIYIRNGKKVFVK